MEFFDDLAASKFISIRLKQTLQPTLEDKHLTLFINKLPQPTHHSHVTKCQLKCCATNPKCARSVLINVPKVIRLISTSCEDKVPVCILLSELIKEPGHTTQHAPSQTVTFYNGDCIFGEGSSSHRSGRVYM